MDFHIPMLPVQKEFFNATEDFVAIVSSRSCGKSWVAIFSALVDLMMGKNVLYMAQTDGAFYKGPWLHLQNFLREFNLLDRWSYNSTYKTGTLDLGQGIKSHFYYCSYCNLSASRGATECSTLYLDEFMLSEPSVLGVTAPCLRGKDAYGHLIVPKIRAVSTPNMESLWQLMVVEHDKHGIRLLRSKMTENVFMTDKQREVMANAIFDPKMKAQEIEGEIILDGGQTAVMNLSDFTTIVHPYHDDGVYAGLDMAHKGQRDSHVFCAVQGNRLLALHQFGKCDHLEVAAWVKRFNERHRIKFLNIDLAWSELVYEQLRYTVPSRQVSFAESPPDDNEKDKYTYANIRAWGYFRLGRQTRDGLVFDVEPSEFIDNDIVSELKREVTNTHFLLDRMGRILIEPKDDIKARLGRSPDVGDAAMLCTLSRPDIMAPTVVKKEKDAFTARQREDLEAIMRDD